MYSTARYTNILRLTQLSRKYTIGKGRRVKVSLNSILRCRSIWRIVCLVTCLVILTPLTACFSPKEQDSSTLPTYSNGNAIHQLTLSEWQATSDASKLATVADFLREELWSENLRTEEDLVKFRRQTERLVAAIDSVVRDLPDMEKAIPDFGSTTIERFVRDGLQGESLLWGHELGFGPKSKFGEK